MTVEAIFKQIKDRTTWPPAPLRPLVAATLADMLAAAVDPAELIPWLPGAQDAPQAPREAKQG